MSQPSTAPPAGSALRPPSDDVRTVVGEGGVRTVLAALDDADCRAILDATSQAVLSAREVSEACDVPLSTTYRKLDALTDAGLVEERTRVRHSGKHVSEYARLVTDVVVSLDGRGAMALQVRRRETPEE